MNRDSSISPIRMLSFYNNRHLIITLVRREVAARYRGSLFGNLWALFTPLFMLAVYTFIFSVVFKARWSGGSDSRSEFALVLFAGLMVFNLFSECFNRAPRLILENVNYVKKVVFPLDILPWVALGSAMINLLISFLVWIAFYTIAFGIPPVTALLFPVVILPLALLVMGVSWALAAMGVYLRDLSQLVGVISTILMFLSPIFYPVEALPEEYRHWLNINPLTPVIAQVRDVLYWGKLPSWELYGITLIAGMAVMYAGFALFQKTRKGFADVL
ncbi:MULTISPECIES: ABC transporter permease [Aeromonas]|uniref:ABC transporter permease n=1 Tax=Aeromonas TaxID=642 RepID=UPI0015DC59DB|nr:MULTISPECIES: ABC transporter permease [Aeromonas]MBL0531167.1 ABC transporter permease [Aeromonas caviae]MBL0652700.1 ABC transporter permease [Aeromonas caviae]WKL90171.1 ABC transporter permease [Aeromonas caviae]WLD19248.1 ABC transporter permease [Aeromonas veronii]BBT22128.1 transport permease protein [Aeromonas caviae]